MKRYGGVRSTKSMSLGHKKTAARSSKRDIWDKVPVISGLIASLAIPVVIAVVAARVNMSLGQRTRELEVIKICVDILRTEEQSHELYPWAEERFAEYAEINFAQLGLEDGLTQKIPPSTWVNTESQFKIKQPEIVVHHDHIVIDFANNICHRRLICSKTNIVGSIEFPIRSEFRRPRFESTSVQIGGVTTTTVVSGSSRIYETLASINVASEPANEPFMVDFEFSLPPVKVNSDGVESIYFQPIAETQLIHVEVAFSSTMGYTDPIVFLSNDPNAIEFDSKAIDFALVREHEVYFTADLLAKSSAKNIININWKLGNSDSATTP